MTNSLTTVTKINKNSAFLLLTKQIVTNSGSSLVELALKRNGSINSEEGRQAMSVSLRFSVISRLAGAAAVISMSGAGSAWAGDGGESLTGLNNVVSELCSFLGYNPTSCPQFPTITQAVLEVAGLETSPPEMVRALNDVAPGSTVDADNAAVVNPVNSSGTTVPLPFPLTSTTSPTLSNMLSTLTPMAFTSATQQNLLQPGAQMNNTTANNTTAAATHLYDPEAKTFFYAVASGPP